MECRICRPELNQVVAALEMERNSKFGAEHSLSSSSDLDELTAVETFFTSLRPLNPSLCGQNMSGTTNYWSPPGPNLSCNGLISKTLILAFSSIVPSNAMLVC